MLSSHLSYAQKNSNQQKNNQIKYIMLNMSLRFSNNILTIKIWVLPRLQSIFHSFSSKLVTFIDELQKNLNIFLFVNHQFCPDKKPYNTSRAKSKDILIYGCTKQSTLRGWHFDSAKTLNANGIVSVISNMLWFTVSKAIRLSCNWIASGNRVGG